MRQLTHFEVAELAKEEQEETIKEATDELKAKDMAVTNLNIALQILSKARKGRKKINYETLEIAERVRKARWNTEGDMSRNDRRAAAQSAGIEWGLYRKLEKLIC